MAIFERKADGTVSKVGDLFSNFNNIVKQVQSKFVKDKDGAVREIYASGPKIIYIIRDYYGTQYSNPQYVRCDQWQNVDITFYPHPSIPRNKCNYVVVNYDIFAHKFESSVERVYAMIDVTWADGTVSSNVVDSGTTRGSYNQRKTSSFAKYITPGTTPFSNIRLKCYVSSTVDCEGFSCISSMYMKVV